MEFGMECGMVMGMGRRDEQDWVFILQRGPSKQQQPGQQVRHRRNRIA